MANRGSEGNRIRLESRLEKMVRRERRLYRARRDQEARDQWLRAWCQYLTESHDQLHRAS